MRSLYKIASADSFVPSGITQLDNILPAGGWPVGALIEVNLVGNVLQHLHDVLILFSQLCDDSHWMTCVAPPHLPEAARLAEKGLDPHHILLVHPHTDINGFTVVEQALKTQRSGAVIAWPAIWDTDNIQRLQVAAQAGHSTGILFRKNNIDYQPSIYTTLSMQVELLDNSLLITVDHITKQQPDRVVINIETLSYPFTPPLSTPFHRHIEPNYPPLCIKNKAFLPDSQLVLF